MFGVALLGLVVYAAVTLPILLAGTIAVGEDANANLNYRFVYRLQVDLKFL